MNEGFKIFFHSAITVMLADIFIFAGIKYSFYYFIGAGIIIGMGWLDFKRKYDRGNYN